VAVNVLPLGMASDAMAGKLAANLGVARMFVGHTVGVPGDLGFKHDAKGFGVDGIHDNAALLAVGLDQGHQFHLVLIATRALGLLAHVAPARFVGFNSAAARAHQACVLRLHRLSNAVGHEPSGLVGDAEHTVQLMRANGLLAGAH
jgi:hypothetical protein